jgi:hypothetical protein
VTYLYRFFFFAFGLLFFLDERLPEFSKDAHSAYSKSEPIFILFGAIDESTHFRQIDAA